MAGQRLTKATRALTDKLEPMVAAAFERSVRETVDGINIKALTKAIEDKDIDAAMEALNLDEAFAELARSLLDTFESGGRLTMNLLAEEAAKQGVGKNGKSS